VRVCKLVREVSYKEKQEIRLRSGGSQSRSDPSSEGSRQKPIGSQGESRGKEF
jgi:hypothetical protein